MELVHGLVALVGMLVGVIATMAALSAWYVGKAECKKTVENCGELKAVIAHNEKTWKTTLNLRLDKMDNSAHIQYHMLRAIVTNMDNLSAAAKTEILNMNGIVK